MYIGRARVDRSNEDREEQHSVNPDFSFLLSLCFIPSTRPLNRPKSPNELSLHIHFDSRPFSCRVSTASRTLHIATAAFSSFIKRGEHTLRRRQFQMVAIRPGVIEREQAHVWKRIVSTKVCVR